MRTLIWNSLRLSMMPFPTKVYLFFNYYYKESDINVVIVADLEPLEHWVRMLTPEGKNDLRTEDLHVLLALKYTTGSSSNNNSNNAITSNQSNRIRPDVVGGLTFEYFPITNCGFLTYLMVPSQGIIYKIKRKTFLLMVMKEWSQR